MIAASLSGNLWRQHWSIAMTRDELVERLTYKMPVSYLRKYLFHELDEVQVKRKFIKKTIELLEGMGYTIRKEVKDLGSIEFDDGLD